MAATHPAELRSTSSRGLAVLERPPSEDGYLAGATILLVHGSMDRSTTFRRTMRHLGDATVIAYDRRGYGESAAAPASRDFTTQVDDLLDVIAGREVTVVGHSYGAAVTAAAAARRPDLIASAACYEPPQPWRPWWPSSTPGGGAVDPDADPAELAEVFMRRMVGDAIWERLPKATREARRAEGAALREEMLALRAGTLFDASSIEVPIIVAAGGEGLDHRRRSAQALADEAPLGRFEEVPGAGHGVHLTHPAELARLARLAVALRDGRA